MTATVTAPRDARARTAAYAPPGVAATPCGVGCRVHFSDDEREDDGARVEVRRVPLDLRDEEVVLELLDDDVEEERGEHRLDAEEQGASNIHGDIAPAEAAEATRRRTGALGEEDDRPARPEAVGR